MRQKAGHFLWLSLALPLLLGSACEKKKPNDPGALAAAERAEATSGPADTTPLAGVDVSKLDAEKQKLFYALINSLTSPCEKPQSLRAAFAPDQGCKRAPYAVKYVLALLEDENEEGAVRKWYTAKYAPTKQPVKIDTSKAPRSGNDDALVQLVEFFDYGCGHCAMLRPILDKLFVENSDKLAIHYMMYPLGNWPHSGSAAQAAIAASQQGKFKEMHALLFARAPQHDRDAVMSYARELGLDMAKFEPAYTAAAAQVAADHQQGKSAGIESTPTIYINGRHFEAPPPPKYLSLWVQEEVAVNR